MRNSGGGRGLCSTKSPQYPLSSDRSCHTTWTCSLVSRWLSNGRYPRRTSESLARNERSSISRTRRFLSFSSGAEVDSLSLPVLRETMPCLGVAECSSATSTGISSVESIQDITKSSDPALSSRSEQSSNSVDSSRNRGCRNEPFRRPFGTPPRSTHSRVVSPPRVRISRTCLNTAVSRVNSSVEASTRHRLLHVHRADIRKYVQYDPCTPWLVQASEIENGGVVERFSANARERPCYRVETAEFDLTRLLNGYSHRWNHRYMSRFRVRSGDLGFHIDPLPIRLESSKFGCNVALSATFVRT